MRVSNALTWEHNPWESVVRDLLHEYDVVNTDEVLRHVLDYVSDDADEASDILETVYEKESEAFMDIMSGILDSIMEAQKEKDILNETDYGFDRESQYSIDEDKIMWLDNKEVYGEELARSLYYYIDIDLIYYSEDELQKFIDIVNNTIKDQDTMIVSTDKIEEGDGGGVLNIVIHPAPAGLKEELERNLESLPIDIVEYTPYKIPE